MSVDAFLTPTYPINWAQLPIAELPAALDKGIALAKVALKAIEETPLEKATYASIVTALEEYSEPLSFAWGIANHLGGVADGKEIRAVQEKYTPAITELAASVGMSAPLWERLQHVEATATGLAALQKRNLELTMRGFRKSGAALPQAQKDELMIIKKRLSVLGDKFEHANLDEVAGYEKLITNVDELKGLPAGELARAADSAKKKGKECYRFTLQAPSLNAIMTYADNTALRHELWEVANDMCVNAPHDTLPYVKEILELRQTMARLLGYKNYADYATTESIIKGGEAIGSFLDTLYAKARPLAQKDFETLAKFKREELKDTAPYAPWDGAYVGEKLKQARLQFSTEETRPYFNFDTIRQSLFDLTDTLFGVKVKKVDGHIGWHPEVAYYEMTDSATGRLLGGFYTDFFPRDEKQSGAWMNELLTGKPTAEGKLSPHIGLICGNFTPPTADKPALLTHDEVTTFYHEYGHLLHHMLTEVQIPSLAGTSVSRDWVEVPSQLLENFCYNPGYLKRIGRHNETGETIPDALIEKLKESQQFLEGIACNRQLSFGTLDIYLHTVEVGSIVGDIELALRKRLEAFNFPFPVQPRPIFRRFGHIFGGGYAASYYSYKESEVLEADMWSRFEKEGVASPTIGADYRRCILATGNSVEPMELFKRFMGREPSMEALIARMGA